jgi:hypothetical protein
MERPDFSEKHDKSIVDILIVSLMLLCVLTSIILIGIF